MKNKTDFLLEKWSIVEKKLYCPFQSILLQKWQNAWSYSLYLWLYMFKGFAQKFPRNFLQDYFKTLYYIINIFQ